MNPNRALGVAILAVLFIGPVIALVFRIPLEYMLSFMAGFIAVFYGISIYRWERRKRDRRERATDAYIEQQIEQQRQERETLK
ncbi:MAG TPA: hypothetical protein VEW28_03800 [Candidatus Kapabacteria bacterium]|nr:hypothetical protein [Candidatus Kapabacteria bacterium]